MSLLNDMLNDIDSNRNTPKITLQATGRTFKPNIIHYLLRYLSIVIIVASLIALVFPVLFNEEKKNEPMKDSQIPSVPVVPKPKNSSALPKDNKQASIDNEISTPIPKATQEKLLDMEEQPLEDEPVIQKSFAPLTSDERKANAYQAAMELATQGLWKKAIQALQSLLKEYPDYIDAYQSLASFQLHTGQLAAAKRTLIKGIRQDGSVELTKMYAHILGEEGQYKKALKVLYQMSPPINQQQDYYAMMAVFFEKLGEVEKAGEIYQSLVNIEPENGAYWLGLAISLEQMNQLNAAVKAYHRVLDNYDSKPMLQAYAAKRLKLLKG